MEFDTSTLNIENGDVVVMVSDGVLMTGSKWIEGMIEHCGGKTARELADEILKEAKARSEDDRSDDLTVLVARIKPGAGRTFGSNVLYPSFPVIERPGRTFLVKIPAGSVTRQVFFALAFLSFLYDIDC